MKSQFKGKVNRTSGWETQPIYDGELSTMDMSSLRFLNYKYKSDIRDFSKDYNLDVKKNFDHYMGMRQRKNMIREELNHRIMDIYASESYQDKRDTFNPDTSLVMDKYNNVLYSIAYTEDYDDIIFDHTANTSGFVSEDDSDETDYTYFQSTEKKILYKDWKYYDE